MTRDSMLMLAFLAGILGGLMLYGRRCQRRSAAARRLAARAPEVSAEAPLDEELSQATGEAEGGDT